MSQPKGLAPHANRISFVKNQPIHSEDGFGIKVE
jgi:hypothetical protein